MKYTSLLPAHNLCGPHARAKISSLEAQPTPVLMASSTYLYSYVAWPGFIHRIWHDFQVVVSTLHKHAIDPAADHITTTSAGKLQNGYVETQQIMQTNGAKILICGGVKALVYL